MRRKSRTRNHTALQVNSRTNMNYEEYRKAYFTDPMPEARFGFNGSFGVTLYFEDYEAAVAFYSRVLGPPAYVEGKGTRGCGTEILITSPIAGGED